MIHQHDMIRLYFGIEIAAIDYPVVISHSYGNSQFSMGKPTINGHFK